MNKLKLRSFLWPFVLVWMSGLGLWQHQINDNQRLILDTQMQAIFLQHHFSVELTQYHRKANSLERELEEFQCWRRHVTIASRVGWQTADWYITQYPLRGRCQDDLMAFGTKGFFQNARD